MEKSDFIYIISAYSNFSGTQIKTKTAWANWLQALQSKIFPLTSAYPNLLRVRIPPCVPWTQKPSPTPWGGIMNLEEASRAPPEKDKLYARLWVFYDLL